MSFTNNILPFGGSNSDPALKSEAVDVSSLDYTPTKGELITAINCSVAGLVYYMDINGVLGSEYLNTGWNACTVCRTINHASTTATPIRAKLAVSK